MGGRSIVHTIDQTFLLYDKKYFNIANTLVFILFVLLIYLCVYGRRISNSFMVFEYVCLWTALPYVGEVILQQTNSCNYLWGTTIILLFFTPYFMTMGKEAAGKNKAVNVVKAVLMFLFGVIAGWTIEAGGAMLLLFIALNIFYYIIKKKKAALWKITGFCGAAAGYAILILAPGNYVRSEWTKQLASRSNFLYEILFRLGRETYYFILHMGLLLFIFALLCCMQKSKNIKDLVLMNKKEFLMFGITLIGVYVMTLTIGYSDRVLVTPIAFLLIAIGLLYKKSGYEKNLKVIYCMAFFACAYLGFEAIQSLMVLWDGSTKLLHVHTSYR